MNNKNRKKWLGFLLLATFISLSAASCATPPPPPTPSLPAPVSQVKTIYYDDFNPDRGDLRNLWVNNGKGHWLWQRQISSLPGCENGCLKQNSEDPRALNAIMYVRNPQMADGIIETKVRMGYDASLPSFTESRAQEIRFFMGAGLVFRMTDENNFYMFRLAGQEGAVFGKMVDGKWFDLANPRRVDFLEGGRIRPNEWYKLKVMVYGNNIKCYLNDTPIINSVDSSFSLGKFGVITFKTLADFEFINIFE